MKVTVLRAFVLMVVLFLSSAGGYEYGK